MPLLPLPVIGAPLQAMLRQQPDVALYGALELELPFLAGRICGRDAESDRKALLHRRCKEVGRGQKAVQRANPHASQYRVQLFHKTDTVQGPKSAKLAGFRHVLALQQLACCGRPITGLRGQGSSPQSSAQIELRTCREKILIWKHPLHSNYLCRRAASLEAVEGPRGCCTNTLIAPLGQQTCVPHLAQHCRSTIKVRTCCCMGEPTQCSLMAGFRILIQSNHGSRVFRHIGSHTSFTQTREHAHGDKCMVALRLCAALCACA